MPPEARAALERWKMNQISILGLDGFNKMQMETLARGKNLHSAIQALFSGQREAELDISEELSPYWNSLQHVFMEARSVKHLEGYVIHPTLHYAGYFDCIAYYKDKLCLIDWKTSTKQKPYLSSTFDNPLQLAAYAGAVNSDSRYNLQIKECLLVIAYADGSPAHAHLISEKKLQKYWEKWLQRVREHWQLVIPERRLKT
ncbi:mitochondrial genome maintenance exonuclease 1-like [Tubulanus polymorphus]|uniref:mitochondrial genome maintenance exonuclease 1-like n=1 Tax=Tubulanus polymorphus TaxID=672921 RepID=UPI003DA25456